MLPASDLIDSCEEPAGAHLSREAHYCLLQHRFYPDVLILLVLTLDLDYLQHCDTFAAPQYAFDRS
jgi:hypothetical protein